MSVFEKKLARFHEAQASKKQRELKKRYGMTESYKKNLIESIQQQINEATDPQLKARLTGQLTRVLTVKPEARAKRSKDFKDTKPKDGILNRVTGSAVDSLPDGDRIAHHLVLQIEAKCRTRGGWNALKREEKDALLAEAKATLSAEEVAAIEALGA